MKNQAKRLRNRRVTIKIRLIQKFILQNIFSKTRIPKIPSENITERIGFCEDNRALKSAKGTKPGLFVPDRKNKLASRI